MVERLKKNRLKIFFGMGLLVMLIGVFGARTVFPLPYQESIVSIAELREIDPPLLAAIVYEESRFDRRSESSAGAVGLMQLMPETAGWVAGELSRPELARRLTDVEPNLILGSWYYRYLLDKYDHEQLALAAYNGGERNLDEWIIGGPDKDPGAVVERITFPETRQFVQRVTGTKRIYELLYPELRFEF